MLHMCGWDPSLPLTPPNLVDPAARPWTPPRPRPDPHPSFSQADIQRLVAVVAEALKTLGVTNTGSALGPSTDPIPGQLKRVDLASLL